MQIDGDEVNQFLKELKELSDRHNIYIGALGYDKMFLLRAEHKAEYLYDTCEANNLFLKESGLCRHPQLKS